MAAGKQLSDYNPSGTALGQAAADKIAFLGAEPVSRYATSVALPSSVAAVSTTATTTWGFATSAQADAIITTVAKLAAAMNAYGLTTSA
jgi:UDP-N-acetyl-D-mannosaminuronic acid transferase (WecB/TagA/CpsF family)